MNIVKYSPHSIAFTLQKPLPQTSTPEMDVIVSRRRQLALLQSELAKLKENNKTAHLVPLKEQQIAQFLVRYPVNNVTLLILERELSNSTGAPTGYASYKQGQILAYWQAVTRLSAC